jgi:integral membrane sensor domain MASE1
LAVVLLFGYRFLPAVFLGAFWANVVTHELIWVPIGIAIGNTLEAWVGAYLLRRVVKFDVSMSHIIDLVGLVILAGCVSTAISATVGSLSLLGGGLINGDRFLATWKLWWSGNAMGDFIFAPLFLLWGGRKSLAEKWPSPMEAAVSMAVIFAVAMVIFTRVDEYYPLLLILAIIFPIMIWVAYRFLQIGVATALAVITTTAVWATTNNMGAFANNGISLEDNLLYLQLLMLVIMSTSMTLAISVSRRREIERALRRRTLELEEANERITKIVSGILEKDDVEAISQDDLA